MKRIWVLIYINYLIRRMSSTQGTKGELCKTQSSFNPTEEELDVFYQNIQA